MEPDGFWTGVKVRLRGLEAGDLEFLYRWENAPEVWQYGDCGSGAESTSGDSVNGVCVADDTEAGAPRERFSRDELRKFIENQQYDI